MLFVTVSESFNVKKKMLCVKVNCNLSRTVSGILSRLKIERIFLDLNPVSFLGDVPLKLGIEVSGP